MATLQYTVWDGASQTADGDVLQENVITVSGTAANSAAIVGTGRRIRTVRIYSDVDCYVTWGASGVTALNDGTEGRMIGADNPEYFRMEAGFEISVIERV